MLSVFPKLAILQLEAVNVGRTLTRFDDIQGLHRRREVFAGHSALGVMTSVYTNPSQESTKTMIMINGGRLDLLKVPNGLSVE